MFGFASSGSGSKDAGSGEPQEEQGGWLSFASSLADTLKKQTNDVAASIQSTDWRAELQAFSKGVSEDTAAIKEGASKHVGGAMEHLPKDAQAALPKLQSQGRDAVQQVGTRFEAFGRGVVASTTDVFNKVRDAIQDEMHSRGDGRPRRGPGGSAGQARSGSASSSGGGGVRYSRLEAEVSAMQRDSTTYCEEPQDTAAYEAWLQHFALPQRKADIDALLASNAFMAELHSHIVPGVVPYGAFWTRYFFRLHQLQARNERRQQVAQRARTAMEEEVAWDDDTAASPHQPDDDSAGAAAAAPAVAPPAAAEHALASGDAEQTAAVDDGAVDPRNAVGAHPAEQPAGRQVAAAHQERKPQAPAGDPAAPTGKDGSPGAVEQQPAAGPGAAAAPQPAQAAQQDKLQMGANSQAPAGEEEDDWAGEEWEAEGEFNGDDDWAEDLEADKRA